MSTLTKVVGAITALLGLYTVNPWIEPPEAIHDYVDWGLWAGFAILLVLLFRERGDHSDEIEIEGPAFTRFLLGNRRAGLFWLPVRMFLGFAWLDAGLHKLQGEGWVDGGAALRGYWQFASSVPEQGRPPITYEWYRDFINLLLANNAETWFAQVIVFGEIAVGLGLILGALTGFAAFFGAFMNMSFLLAGSASTNPVLFTLAISLVLAWRVAGYYGLDRAILPMLGTPWRLGSAGRAAAATTMRT